MIKENEFVRVLSVKPFRNLWLSQLVSQTFLNLLFFSLMIRVYELTHANSAVGFMVLLVTLPNILLAALAGVLVDRGDRKIVMFLSHFLRVFAVLAFLVSAETLGWLYFLVFLISTISQFFFPAEAATIHELIKDKKLLLTANSLFSVTFFATVIVGNVLAGPFLSVLGMEKTFVLVALAFLAASAFTASLPGERIKILLRKMMTTEFWKMEFSVKKNLTAGELFSEFLTGVDHIYKTPIVIRAIFLLGLSQTTIGSLGAIAPGFADSVLHIPVTDVSIVVMAPAAAGMILGAVLLGQFFQKISRQKLVESGLFIVGGGLLLFSLVDLISILTNVSIIFWSGVLLLILGASNAMVDVPSNTLIQENTPEEIRSRVYGVLNTFVGIGAIIPIVLSGILADILGVRTVVSIIGVIVLGFAIYNHRKKIYVADNL